MSTSVSTTPSALADSVAAYALTDGSLVGNKETNQTYLQAMLTLECYLCECEWGHDFTKMLRKWGDEDDTSDVPFCPLDQGTFKRMLIIFMADPTQMFQYNQEDGGVGQIFGRGYEEGSIKKVVQHVNYIHTKCNQGDQSPCKDLDVKRWIGDQKAAHQSGCHQAPTIDYVDGLPALYNAIWSNGDDNFYDKVYKWTIVLFFIWFAARPVEVADYCPYMEHIKLPSTVADFDTDGIPRYVEVGFRDWKHRTKKHVGTGPFYMLIFRNYLDTKYCLLFWLLMYLQKSKISDGPIFRNYNQHGAIKCYSRSERTPKGQQVFYYKSENPKAQRANLTTEAVNAILAQIFTRAGYPQCSGYTFRRSSVKWWYICGAQEWEIRNGGRWKSNYMHAVYLEEGQLEALAKQADHPIRKMWVWKNNTRCIALAQEFGGRVQQRR